ncbi:hypothetical protein ACFS32_14725 [Novosphingobium pokkalii]|uniref:hypothetical protein n=1 Tax=Novosphingobium pokkalii TaxID=1770194 RepID=UPI00362B7BBF
MLTHFDFTDHFRFKGEAWFSKDYATNIADQPFYNTALFGAAGMPTATWCSARPTPT